jgi:hypothetical protein
MLPTLGSRVSSFLVRTTFHGPAAGSHNLQSLRGLQALMAKGGVGLFQGGKGVSRFGAQTGKVHGGLLFSRSPTRFWHHAAGMLRDVDMAACYQRIIEKIEVYWGRPVVFEPGDATLTLAQAVALVRQHAADDAWMIRASGDIHAIPNALIPSCPDALTSQNYHGRKPAGQRQRARRRAFHLEARRDPGSVKGTAGARLYSGRVESGVATAATWALIQALPAGAREEYEALTADSVIFYPRKLAAADGPEFDELIEAYRHSGLPWQTTLDLVGMQLVQVETIDADYVTLKYPISEYAALIGKYRKEAQKAEGKGSGMDLAWKVTANTMYGVLASSHLATNNFVAANQITAHARAEAFAMSQALNAIQTITDGCTYRLDQVPAITFPECLEIRPDYPLRRAEDGDGIPFLSASAIPQDDEGFTAWYREHVKWFFGVGGPEYDALFGTHALEHKMTGVTKRVAFDALGCDGSGNYVKATAGDNGAWVAEDFAARSYRKQSKAALGPWLVGTYAQDRLVELPPVTKEAELLSFARAAQKARKAIESGIPEVYFPLGLEHTKVLAYRALKASAFIFETPEQRAAVVKQWLKFESRTGAGLELLALRRGYKGRRCGSLRDLAEAIYELIRSGDINLTRALNLNRLGQLEKLSRPRKEMIAQRKQAAEQGLMQRIDLRNIDGSTLATACIVTAADVVEDGQLALKPQPPTEDSFP